MDRHGRTWQTLTAKDARVGDIWQGKGRVNSVAKDVINSLIWVQAGENREQWMHMDEEMYLFATDRS